MKFLRNLILKLVFGPMLAGMERCDGARPTMTHWKLINGTPIKEAERIPYEVHNRSFIESICLTRNFIKNLIEKKGRLNIVVRIFPVWENDRIRTRLFVPYHDKQEAYRGRK